MRRLVPGIRGPPTALPPRPPPHVVSFIRRSQSYSFPVTKHPPQRHGDAEDGVDGGTATAFTAKSAKEGTRSQKRSAWTADGLPSFMRRSADASRSTLSRRSGVHRPTSRFQSSSLMISTDSPSGWTYTTTFL